MQATSRESSKSTSATTNRACAARPQSNTQPSKAEAPTGVQAANARRQHQPEPRKNYAVDWQLVSRDLPHSRRRRQPVGKSSGDNMIYFGAGS